MLKRFLIAVAVVIAAFTAVESYAADVMVGAKGGYYVWVPFYRDLGASGMSDIDQGTGMLAGPVFSFVLSPDFTFSLAGLAGRQSTHWQSLYSDFEGHSNTQITGGYYFDVLRVDIDSALSYRLDDMFKVFVGYKYLYLRLDYRYTEIRTMSPTGGAIDETDTQNAEFVTPFHGPAIGLGVTRALSERVFLSANFSCMYMWGNFDNTKHERYSYTSDDNFASGEHRTDVMTTTSMEQFGMNIEPMIGFNPGNDLPIISLGLRFQWLRVKFTENTTGEDAFPDKWLNDYLYGIFVSAIYVF